MDISIVDLEDCVNRDDAPSFLLLYLELIKSGCTLSVPSSDKRYLCKQEWQDQVPKSCAHGTEAFFLTLADLWLELMTNNTLKDKDQLLDALIMSLKFKHKELAKIKEDGHVYRAATGQLKEVAANISDDYMNDQVIRNQALLKQDDAAEQLQQAFDANDSYRYFDLFMQGELQKESFHFPKSTVLTNINSFWDQQLATQKSRYKQAFIQELSSYSFYVLNTNGIPSDTEALKTLWVLFKSKYKQPSKTNTPKSWFRRLFS